jgi:uncharacterized protein (DUF1800 family)
MRFPRVRVLACFAAAGALALTAVADQTPAALTSREQALHVLNRLGFGPRPGDIDRVLAMGVGAYVEQQLHPSRIPDGAVEARLAGLGTLGMSNAQLVAQFEVPLREARKRLKAEKASVGANAGTGNPDADAADLAKLGALIPPESRPRRILEDLTQERLFLAAGSERQLNEVMVDFWMNHFNVYANKGLDRIFIGTFERDTVRPRIWGRFEDLLLATAQSPAMLVYLDNARSVADEEHRPAAFTRARGAGARGLSGLNENYARELMELHTLGVDGGYTQRDVTELSRVLTGWSIGAPRAERADLALRPGRAFRREPEEPGSFVFRARLHDTGEKTVLGRRFPAGGGIEEGEAALRMLAREPATARHLAYEICQHLVADEPPPALVERAAQRYLATGGDLTETVRAVVTSPEFFDPRSYRAKIKSPFEYAVSAVRAVGSVADARALAMQIAEMGEPLYLCQPPTGYPDTASAWVNSGALLARLNFAIALAQGRLAGTSVDAQRLPAAGPGRRVQDGALLLVGTDVSAETLATISRRMADDAGGDSPRTLMAGLLLGSPEFQRQ